MEVPRLGVERELQQQVSAMATDPSHVCHLHCSLWQCQILNPLREARDQLRILAESMSDPLSHNRNSVIFIFDKNQMVLIFLCWLT